MNFIALVWTLIVEIIGVRQLQELYIGKAVLAVILAIAIMLIIICAVIVILLHL